MIISQLRTATCFSCCSKSLQQAGEQFLHDFSHGCFACSSFLCCESCDVAFLGFLLFLLCVLLSNQAVISVPVLSVGHCLHFFGCCFLMFRELDLWCTCPKREKSCFECSNCLCKDWSLTSIRSFKHCSCASKIPNVRQPCRQVLAVVNLLLVRDCRSLCDYRTASLTSVAGL